MARNAKVRVGIEAIVSLLADELRKIVLAWNRKHKSAISGYAAGLKGEVSRGLQTLV